MRKPLLYLATLAILATPSCKKDDDVLPPPGGGGTSFTPAYLTPTEPGYIQVATAMLVLHPGNSTTLSAQLFGTDGQPVASQPSFIWTSDNNAVASVSGNQLTAGNVGTATVTVTDGTHGLRHVQVQVISSSETIGSGPSSVMFNPVTLVLQPGSSAGFQYEVFNPSGQALGASGIQFFSAGGNISVSGTNVTAGQQEGIYTVGAIAGSDTLAGQLQVVVSSGGSVLRSIDGVRYPAHFGKPGLTAAAVLIDVTETTTDGNGNVSVNRFQTSPTEISVQHSDVIGNSGGYLTSVNPGYTKVTVTYNDVSVIGYAGVRMEHTGNYQSIDANLYVLVENEEAIWYYNPGQFTWSSVWGMPQTAYKLPCSECGLQLGEYSSQGFLSPFVVSNPEAPMVNSLIRPLGRMQAGEYLFAFRWMADEEVCPGSSFGVSPLAGVFFRDDNSVSVNPTGTTYPSGGQGLLVAERGATSSSIAYQNEYSDFGATTSLQHGCPLSYFNTLVMVTFPEDGCVPTLALMGQYEQPGLPNDPDGVCTLWDGYFNVEVELTLTAGSYTGSYNYIGWVFLIENGTVTGDVFNASVTVSHNSWNPIFRTISLERMQ
jgi:hypothetical protein